MLRLRVIEELVDETYISSQKKERNSRVAIKKRKPFVSAKLRTKEPEYLPDGLEDRR